MQNIGGAVEAKNIAGAGGPRAPDDGGIVSKCLDSLKCENSFLTFYFQITTLPIIKLLLLSVLIASELIKNLAVLVAEAVVDPKLQPKAVL